jgi:hypothetical protein
MRRPVIDRMALLCTLHADGPRTLRILREAGCDSLEALAGMAPERVAGLLALPEAAARRLGREARRLTERLEPDLEQEEVTYPAGAGAREAQPPVSGLRIEAGVSAVRREGTDAVGARERLALRDRALLDRVVERWRERDDSEAPGTALSQSEELEQLRQVEIRAGEVREADPEEPGELVPGSLPGLDAGASEALRRAGISGLEELATCPVDELQRRTGLGFTRVRTLQFHAGRSLEASPAPAEQEPLPTERLSPSGRPPERELAAHAPELPDDGGAAGPFA